ncbi:MAG TPA: DUF1697 domain-containing protein [Thermoanaerobaculia bacterium]|nr:DUF1697 domain-containing protein [Thermoanaerobaculia bacterium]
MPTHAAFLRGMNLGNRRITNDELCACFEAMGFTDVAAFLASGNVVFSTDEGDAEALAEKIEKGLEEALGYAVPTYLRSADEVREIAGREPFGDDELAASDGKPQVALLAAAPGDAARDAALAHASDADRLAIHGRELHWLPAGRLTDSELDLKAVEKAVGGWTMRTVNTLRRLAKKFFAD